jgi:hypothetical protein
MSVLSLRLPDSLHRMVREVAAKDSVSINQFIATAVAEKMSALFNPRTTWNSGRDGLTRRGSIVF